jgi:N-methylhydantoinase A
VIYPLGAGVISAIGFLTAPLSLDFVRTFPGPLDRLDWAGAAEVVAAMEAEGKAVLGRTIDADSVRFRRFADMRYRKQGYEIRVPIPDGPIGATCRASIQANFEAAYRSIYGHTVADTAIDVVSWRVIASGPKPEVVLPAARSSPGGSAETARKGTRRVYLPAMGDFAEVPVYDRYGLGAGIDFEGPAIVEERESTVVVNGPAAVHVDDANNLIVELAWRA